MNDRDDDFDDRDDAFDPYDDASSRRLPQGVVLFAAALLTLVGFAAVVLIAYNLGVQDGLKRAPTIVAAPEGPYRTPPTEEDGPSGFVAPHQDREILARAEDDDTADAAPPPDYGREADQLNSLIEDRVADEPAETDASEAPAEQVDAPPPARPAEPIADSPAPTTREPSPTATPSQPPRDVAPTPQSPTSQSPAAQSATDARYFVQVASVLTNAEDADREWARFDSRFGETVPPGRGKDVRRVELPDGRIAFRVRVGPFEDRASANAYCDALKGREQSCLVTKG